MADTRRVLGVLVASLFLIGGLLLFTSGTCLSQFKQGATYQLLWEKSYDKELKRAVFDVRNGRIYPKVAVIEGEILFFDKSGSVMRKEILTFTRNIVESSKPNANVVQSLASTPTVFISRSGKYIGLDRALVQTQKHENVEYEFRVLDDQGREIWKRERPIASHDESTDFLISDKDGSIAFVRSQFGGIRFVREENEKEIACAPYKPRGAFSDDGEYFSAMFREIPLKQSLGNSVNTGLWVVLYDRNGTELWRRELTDAQYPGNIDVSRHGEYTVASGTRVTETEKSVAGVSACLFERNGAAIPLTEPVEFDLGMSCFSGDSRFVALSKVTDAKVKVFETRTGGKVFQREFEYRPVKILLSHDGSLLVVETHKRFRPSGRSREQYRGNKARIYVLDILSGAVIWSETFNEVFGMTPALSAISPHARQMAFKFEKRLAIYGR